jgi:hypothetical protein
MPDSKSNPPVIRAIDFRSAFPFTHVFRAGHIAGHPSKVLLALVAILLVYLAGRLLDRVWPTSYQAVTGEVGWFEQSSNDPTITFADHVRLQREQAKLAFERAQSLAFSRIPQIAKDSYKVPNAAGLSYRDVSYLSALYRDNQVKRAREAYDKIENPTDTDRQALRADITKAYRDAVIEVESVALVKGRGLFATYLDYQLTQVDRISNGVVRVDFFGDNGVFASLYRLVFISHAWAFTKHPVFFTLLLGAMLCVWALFGGAISRMAAVEIARDERVSIRSALRFSSQRFLSFFMAPLLPIAIFFIFGLVLAIAGALLNIPILGPIVVGAGFVLVLGMGILLVCVILGGVGGFGLMYPTIAVEGSDAFDAISRSYSYVFARPWRLGFYTFVALLHAAVIYFVLRLLLWGAMLVSHGFTQFFVFSRAGDQTYALENLWPAPTSFGRLSYSINSTSLTFSESIGAFFIAGWVYLLLGLLGAFIISLYIASSSIIYYLMRFEVDATELDDVFIEPGEDDFDDEIPATPVATAEGVPTTAAAASGS